MVFITASVNVCQPILLWEAGCPARTVSTEFRSSTPCSAHGRRSGLPDILMPRSLSISLNMFFRDGGASTPCGTENDRPMAWP